MKIKTVQSEGIELYNNHDQEICSGCGYVQGKKECKKRCGGDTSSSGSSGSSFAVIPVLIILLIIIYSIVK